MINHYLPMAPIVKVGLVLFIVICNAAVYTILDAKIEDVKELWTRKMQHSAGKTAIVVPNVDNRAESKPPPTLKYCNVIDLKAENNNNFTCVTMKMDPPAPICVHDPKKDKVISRSLVRKGFWEKHLVSEVMEALNTHPDSGLIDIGANIGAFTLLAAKSGHKVVAVEPIIENIERIHKSAQLGNTIDKITLVRNAIANVRSWGESKRNPTNLGGSPVVLGAGAKCMKNCSSDVVDTILMDDLLEVITFKKAVIKIDCEGCEHRAFNSAQQMLEKLDIKLIQMEWNGMKRFKKQEDTDLVKSMIKIISQKGFTPRKMKRDGGEDLKIEDWGRWPFNIVWYLKQSKK